MLDKRLFHVSLHTRHRVFSTWERLGTEFVVHVKPSDTVVTGRDSSSSPAAAFSRRKKGGCKPRLAGSN